MKKLLSILALALCFVACQNEPEVNVSNSDLVDVVLNIEAPELGITRAGDDGDSKNAKDSAYGAIDYADADFWDHNDIRYILEVYAENDSDGSEGRISKDRLVNCLDAYAPTEFKLRLVPNRTYKFVVFADFVAQGSHQLSNPLEIADVYYDTKDLRDITSLTRGTQWNAMNEARDAYFITENIHVTTGLEQDLILTRPFAKVRVVTTDILDLEKYATPTKVVVTYYNHPIFKSFNAVNGAISTEMTGDELTHVVTYNDQYDAGYDSENSGCMTLYADYIHAIADQQSNINFRMDVFDLSGRLLKSNDFSTEIPVQRNHLTTLIGNVLTTEAKVQILISDEFVGNHNELVPDRIFDNDTIIVTGFENGGTYANGAYSYNVSNATTDESFTLNIKDSALKNGTLQKGEYEYGTDFTATDVMVNMPLTRAAAAATAEGGKMFVDIDENNKYTIAIDLVVKDDANNFIYPSFGYYGDFAIKAVEPLAAPANFVGTVEGEKVTFTWTAVEKATSYDVVFNGITATISEGTTATFTVQATDEEQKLTASIVANADGYKTSEAATCEVVIPAKAVEPAEPVVLYLQPNANWNTDNARFAAYFFNNDGNTWADMTLVEGETNIYTVTVPAGFDNIIFCRMNPTATANDWNNKWNQTADLKVPTDGTNLYTITEGAWDKGTWSIFTATTPVVPVAIATPNVTVSVDVNVVTLNWDAVEGAAHYTVQVDDDVEEVVNETSYTFEGDYEVEYTFTVKAIAADTEKNLDSEAAVVTATTEAKPETPEEPVYTSVADFLDAAEDDTVYTLKGTITAVAETTYGNFDLTDETGTVHIYGLCSPEGVQKYWATSGAKLGDDIVVKTIRTSYNSTPQGKNALFVELLPGTLAFWKFDATSASFSAAADNKSIGVTIYNTTAIVSVESDNAQFSGEYADGVLTISALENTSSDPINGNITVTCGTLTQVIAVSQLGASSGTQTVEEATISFADKANRTEYSTSKQVWEQNGIKVTNEKAGSTTNVGDYANPGRFYKGSNVKIEAPGAILSISIDVTGIESKYKSAWGSDNNGIVTITLDGTSNTYEFTNLSAQARANKMTITYLE
ncbi:MAG: BACON domain-containing protein [Alistipes sp.]|nr:BACON domain-containing protein [Alistipes sp.]